MEANRLHRVENEHLTALVTERTRELERELAEREQTMADLRESETLLRAFFDSPGLLRGVVELTDGDILHISDSATSAEFFGLTVAGMRHKRASEMGVPPETIRVWRDGYEKSRQTGHPVSWEYCHNQGGDSRHFRATVSHLVSAESVDRYTYAIEDISKQKYAEENYESLFREMIDGFALHEIICDEAGNPIDYRFLAVNPTFERITGLTAKNIIGRTVMDVLPRTERHWIETYGRVALTGEPVSFESCAIELEKCFAVAAFRPSPNQFACTFTDITQRKLAEKELRRSEQKRRRLFETMNEGVFYQRADGQLIDANDAALRMFGLSRDEFLGRTSMHSQWDVIREDGTPLPGPEHPSMLALKTGKPVQDMVVGMLNPRTKAYTWVSVSGIPEFREGESTPFQVTVTMHDLTARKQAETALQASERRLSDILFSMADWVWEVDEKGVYTYVSPKGMELLGDVIGKTPFDFMAPDEVERVAPIFSQIVQNKTRIENLENWNISRTGERICFLTNGVPILDEAGTLKGYRGVDQDITERKRVESEHGRLEAQLAQAQKMESVGRLAGGVAHDFNNLLMGTMNYVELCRDGLEPDHPNRKWLDEITADSQRSANLTRQLLTFARKQVIAPKVLDLNDVVSSMLKLLRRLIGEDVDLAWLPGPVVGTVKMDPSQVDQILANLAVNARDAIGDVGKLTIETRNVTFDATYCAGHVGFLSGDYVLLAVSDDGCGMDAETREQIFEPFFTTKGEGEGTGLGLATVYGIVTQNNGFINVYSEAGEGTTFKIYLPRFLGESAGEADAAAPVARPGGNETILLVEDEKSIRVTAGLFLETFGYAVLTADSPAEALRLAGEHPGRIHLLITDVIMPGMSGRDLANRLSELRPSIQCLFISGFTADIIAQRGILDDGVNFLSKPFGRDVLAHKVREVLDDCEVQSPRPKRTIPGEAL